MSENSTLSLILNIGGSEYTKATQVFSVEISKSVNRIAKATVKLVDGDPTKQSFAIADDDTVKPGSDIEIKAGGKSGSEETIFKGIITGIGIEASQRRSYTVLTCMDNAVKMTRARNTKAFLDQTESDIVESILGDYSDLTTDVDSTSTQFAKLLQFGVTDWDFVMMRAEANGFLVFCEDNNLKVKEPSFSGEPEVTLEFNKDIINFDGKIDAEPVLSSTSSKAWSYDDIDITSQDGSVSSSPPFLGDLDADSLSSVVAPDSFTIIHSGSVDTDSLTNWANGQLMRSQLAANRGSISAEGRSDVALGDLLGIDGFGTRFKGSVFVSGVRHDIKEGNWISTFEFGLSEKYIQQLFHDVNAAPAAGLSGGIHGLQLGKVTGLAGDPDSQNRIKVKLPVFGDDAEVWCRLVFADAGPSRGIFFVPEVDDEVLVGFLDNDPSQPVVLGTLFNGTSTPPQEITDDNNIRQIVSKGGIKITMDDDSTSLKLETSGGNSIELNDDSGITITDANGNSIELSSSGITASSGSDLSLSATQNLDGSASGGNLTLSGLQVSLSADTEFKAEGSASSEISSSGMTNIKGSIVNIN